MLEKSHHFAKHVRDYCKGFQTTIREGPSMKGMKFIKTILATTVVGAMLAGCGAVEVKNNTGGSTAPAGSAANGGDKQYTIAFVPKLVGFPYFTSMDKGAQKAAKEFGVKWIYQGPTTADVSEQAKYVSGLIDQKVDAVGVAANSPTALDQLISKAKGQDIKFFTSDSDVSNDDRAIFIQQATDKDLGYAMADIIAEEVGGEGKVGILSAGSTATNLNAWIGFVKERLAEKAPGVKLLETQYAGEDINKSTQIASQIIAANPDIKGFIGISAANTPGIAEAVKQAGKAGQIAVTGIALPNVVKGYIKSDVIKKAILWDPEKLGYLTVWGVLQTLKGTELQAENDVPGIGKVKYDAATKALLLGPPLVFDKSNIDNYDF
jgi:rhamnose transport system substrate-binding protein